MEIRFTDDRERQTFERLLRSALQTELSVRLRPALLHALKGPSQTILSALHLLQKYLPPAAAQQTNPGGSPSPAQKYLDWIREAVDQNAHIADLVLPAEASGGAVNAFELHTLAEKLARLFRDEAALHAILLSVDEQSSEVSLTVDAGELRLAAQALLARVLDQLSEGAQLQLQVGKDGSQAYLAFDVTGSSIAPPSAEWFDLRFDTDKPLHGIAGYLARAIIQRLGGDIHLETRNPQSWRVTVRLPHGN